MWQIRAVFSELLLPLSSKIGSKELCFTKVLNDVELLSGVGNMPGKWQLLIFLGQQTILNLQNGEAANCS